MTPPLSLTSLLPSGRSLSKRELKRITGVSIRGLSNQDLLALCSIDAQFAVGAPPPAAPEEPPLPFDVARLPLWEPVRDFPWRNPTVEDYARVWRLREERLEMVRAEPGAVAALKAWYRDRPVEFIEDWGITEDPRNLEIGLPVRMPFLLFPRQREFVDYVVKKWRAREPGLMEKSRDMGATWLAMAISCTLCLHHPGMAIGFGSRKEEYVDKSADPKTIFHKGRAFLGGLPEEFRGGWDVRKHAPHMRLIFPESGSTITGEAGDNIGRGDRKGIFFVDESAFLERPGLIDASLSATTNCRIDMSSVNGSANPFAMKRHGGKIEVFTFHYRDDPRRDDAWAAKKKAELDHNPVTWAQEYEIDYSASVEGVVIPATWVNAAVDAHLKLKIDITGSRRGAFDVADEGRDRNAFIGGHGILIDLAEEWSGIGSDIFRSVERAFGYCDEHDLPGFRYDADGLGAGVAGDSRVINARRRDQKAKVLQVEVFRGSAAVARPDQEDVKGRKNKDFFKNAKAQGWWALRRRFQATYRAITTLQDAEKAAREGKPIVPPVIAAHDDLISISSAMPLYRKLCSELSQATYEIDTLGKMVVNKAPDGVPSPNLADGTMMYFAPAQKFGFQVTPGMLERSLQR